MSRIDFDQIDADAAAERRRERDRHREPGPRRPRRDDRDLTPRRREQAAMIDQRNLAAATIEMPCPVCLAEVYAPPEAGARVDCLECGAALATRGALAGESDLQVVDEEPDTMVVDDPTAPAPPLGAGRHLAAFDASDIEPEPESEPESETEPQTEPQTDLFPPGGWQRRAFAAINEAMGPRSKKP